MSSGPDALARLAIEWECEKLVRRFALLSDAKDADGVASLFTEDGTFARPTDPANPVRGRAAIRAAFAGRPRERVTRHLCANTVVEVMGPAEAHGHSYVVLYTGAADPNAAGPVQADPAQLVGAYRDRFALVGGRWLFAERIGSLALSYKGTQA